MSYNHYICPICASPLTKQDKCFVCRCFHSFDIAKEGYINLAAFTKGAKPDSGDSKQMCKDRRLFLEQDFYKPAADKIAQSIKSLSHQDGQKVVVDAGSGEGYYLRSISSSLDESFTFYGIDLAKEGIKLAAKAQKSLAQNVSFAVAGIFDLPFADSSADFILSVFAPISQTEFSRVLKSGGYLIVLCPAEKHLYGLKEKIYDAARENEEKVPDYDGFTLVNTERITYTIDVDKQYIPAMFGMTPYYWKSSKETQNAVLGLESITTPVDFLLKIYKNK